MPQAIPTMEKARSAGHRFLFSFLFTYVSFFTHIITTLIITIFLTNSVRPEIDLSLFCL